MQSYLDKSRRELVKRILLIVLSVISLSVRADINDELADTMISAEQISSINTSIPKYVIIRSSDQVTYKSETNASVAAIYVKEGSTFNAGEVLLRMDCRVQEADLKKARAQQLAARTALDSSLKLKGYGSISEFELIQAKTQADMATADVNRLTAIVDKCTIIAPFRGAVSDVMVHNFETVEPADPLLKIVNTEKLDFELQVPSTWLKWLRIGTLFEVHINELNTKVEVKVTKINPQIDSVSQTVRIIGALTQPNPALLPGMSGQATFFDHPDNTE